MCRGCVLRARPVRKIGCGAAVGLGSVLGVEDTDELIDAIIRAYTVFGIDPTDGADELGVGNWLEKLHPRDRLGQWREVLGRLLQENRERRAGIPAVRKESDPLLEKLRKGGFTYHIGTGNYPDHGNSVAVTGFGKEFDDINDVTRDDIVEYTRANVKELRKDPSRHLGAWLEGNKAFLDVAEVLDDTPEEALERARSRGEIASFDLATFTTSYVPYYRDDPPPPGSAAARALALPEGHKDKIYWAGDRTPEKQEKKKVGT